MTVMARPRTLSTAAQINGWGEARPRPPISLPCLDFMAEENDPKETAERIVATRIIRAGRDAWQAINKAESFDGWAAIGKALAVGRDYALKATGANAPMGRRYSLAFSDWIKRHGFVGMQKSVRSVTLELHANIEAITAWRDSLPERQRKRLIHPLSVTRRWRASLNHGNGKCPADLRRDAVAAWRRFVSRVELLPPDQAAPLWQTVLAEAASEAHVL
jgi:hypothetical protein